MNRLTWLSCDPISIADFSIRRFLRTIIDLEDTTTWFMTALFVISAPSGAGKTSLLKAALETDKTLSLSISHTTRTQRDGEINGQDYHFVSQETFKSLNQENAFLESAEVFGNFYGTSKGSIEDLMEQGKDVILEIDWQGAEQVKKLMPECIAITILPPSRQALEDRLRGRQQDSEDIIAKRMQEAANEMSHYASSDYLIINDQFDSALNELLTVFKGERLRCQHQAIKHQALIAELLQ